MSLAMGTTNISFNRAMNKISDALRPILVLNKNSGATLEGAEWDSTHPGRLHFDGSNDYCRMENVIVHRTGGGSGNRTLMSHMGGSSAGTISWWWKLPSGHTPHSADYMFSINTGTGGNVILVGFNYLKIKIYVVGTGGTSNTYYSDFSQSQNTWYLYTIVIENTGYKFYINGVEKHHYQATSSSAYLGFNTNDRWTLGGEWDTNSMGNYTAGECQHFAVWDIALSEGAISQIYSDGENYPPSIVMGTPNYISTWNTTTIGCPVPNHTITDSTNGIIKNNNNMEWYNDTWIFNGIDDYIQLEGAILSTFNGSNNMSFSCWIWHENSSSSSSDVVYSDHETASNRYLHKLDGPTGLFKIYYSSSDKFRFNKHMEYNWTHYAFTRERVGTESFLRMKIYINGKKIENGLVDYRANNPYGSNSDDNSFESYNWAFNSNTRFSLGQEWDTGGSSDYFKGMLKNVHFWSSVLTDEQIAGVFRAEFGRSGISMNHIRSIEPKMTDNNGPSSNSALSFNSQFRNHTVKDGDNQ